MTGTVDTLGETENSRFSMEISTMFLAVEMS